MLSACILELSQTMLANYIASETIENKFSEFHSQKIC